MPSEGRSANLVVLEDSSSLWRVQEQVIRGFPADHLLQAPELATQENPGASFKRLGHLEKFLPPLW